MTLAKIAPRGDFWYDGGVVMEYIGRLIHIARKGMRVLRAIEHARKEGDFKKYCEDINATLAELGPTFIKLGQMLALRADLIPSPLTDELRKLLDRGNPISAAEVEALFKKEVG